METIILLGGYANERIVRIFLLLFLFCREYHACWLKERVDGEGRNYVFHVNKNHLLLCYPQGLLEVLIHEHLLGPLLFEPVPFELGFAFPQLELPHFRFSSFPVK